MNSSHGSHVSAACHLKFGIPNTFSKINHNWDQGAHQYINNIATVYEQSRVWLPFYDSEKLMSSVDENRHLGGDYARPEL